MRLHVGCAMWTHKAWPAPPTERLRSYAGWCNAVEGNTTFYATPAQNTVASWAQQTDPGFRFVIKLPKRISHERRLTGADEELRIFLDAIEPLGSRTHALWIQLPGSFTPADTPALAGFLRRLPRSHRYAVEVRHPGFFDEPGPLESVLAAVDAEWIPFDTTALFTSPPTSEAERDAWNKKPRMPLRTVALTDRPIVRYLGRDSTARTIEGWQPLGRDRRRVVAGRALANGVHPHAGQRGRAHARAPLPRRGAGPGAGARGVAGARGRDALLTVPLVGEAGADPTP